MDSNPENLQHDQDLEHINLSSTREITWKIRNFQSLPKALNYSLDSPPFDFENATWCLRLYPYRLIGGEETPYIGFMIVRLCSRVLHHRLHYSLIWPDEYFGVHSMVGDFDEDLQEKGDTSFIERFLSARYADSSIDEMETLTLRCILSSRKSSVADAFSQTEQDIKNVGDLCQNLKDLLLNGQDHDLVLKVKDKELRAHQTILRARSPVLQSMLSHDMIEKNSGVVDIPDCDPGAFEQFLLYLYGGEAETLDADNMLGLYYIADKYDAGHLKELCRRFIMKSLTSDNVSDVIELAMNHSDAVLLGCGTEYFVKRVRSVLRTVGWQSFARRNIIQANELFIKAADKWDDEAI